MFGLTTWTRRSDFRPNLIYWQLFQQIWLNCTSTGPRLVKVKLIDALLHLALEVVQIRVLSGKLDIARWTSIARALLDSPFSAPSLRSRRILYHNRCLIHGWKTLDLLVRVQFALCLRLILIRFEWEFTLWHGQYFSNVLRNFLVSSRFSMLIY